VNKIRACALASAPDGDGCRKPGAERFTRYKFDSRVIRADLDEAANRKIPAKFEVLVVVHVKAEVFWEVAPHRLVNVSYLVYAAEITSMMIIWTLSMKWAGYVAICWGREGAYRIFDQKLQRKRPFGRPRYR
jgi:hypothetical protein